MADGEVEFIKTRDTSDYDRGGNIVAMREYVFFIGKAGPFTEKVPIANFDPYEITRRVELLKSHLGALPK